MKQKYRVLLHIAKESLVSKSLYYPIDSEALTKEIEELEHRYYERYSSSKKPFVEVKYIEEFPICYESCPCPFDLKYTVDRFLSLAPIKKERLIKLNRVRHYLDLDISLIIIDCDEFYKIAMDSEREYIKLHGDDIRELYLGAYYTDSDISQ